MTLLWDPPKSLITFPSGHEIRFYGLLFALGAWIAWLLIRKGLRVLLIDKGEDPGVVNQKSTRLLDKLTWLSILCIVIGARLAHLLFYDLAYFIHDPFSLFRIWEGGLASHGGTIGGLIAVSIFWSRCKTQFLGASFLEFFDRFLPPIAIASACIRLGNFFNQEILGSSTTLPWGVTFLHPVDGGEIISRHPVQLYEAFAYLSIFWILQIVAKKKQHPGVISGLFFVLVFGARCILETWKDSQHGIYDGALLSTGQLLSLPLIAFGIFLIYIGRRSLPLKLTS